MPYLGVSDAAGAIAFAQSVFGASLHGDPLKHADGTIWIAELILEPSRFLIASAQPGDENLGFLYVYVEDCDAVYQRAVAAGAETLMASADQFYGDRNAGVRDPRDNLWWIAACKEAIDPDELQRRADAASADKT